jgi:group I intron endonuclease
MFIYKITNLVNGKVYIGQTTRTVEERWKEHCYSSNKGFILNKAIKKYKKQNFKIETIEKCNSIEELNNKEIYWIKYYNSNKEGYNIALGGNAPMFKRNHTKNSINKIIKSTTNKNKSKQHSENISLSKLGNKNPMFNKCGIFNSRSKAIICIELGKRFESIHLAAKELKIAVQNINKVLKQKRKSAGGYTFIYVED